MEETIKMLHFANDPRRINAHEDMGDYEPDCDRPYREF